MGANEQEIMARLLAACVALLCESPLVKTWAGSLPLIRLDHWHRMNEAVQAARNEVNAALASNPSDPRPLELARDALGALWAVLS